MIRRLFLLTLLCAPMAAYADETPKTLGSFGAWRAYAVTHEDQPVCYMILTTHFPKNKALKRGESQLMITHRPAENSLDVVSYLSGYTFAPASEVKVHIGDKDFILFTEKQTAWAHNTTTDHALSLALRSFATLTLTGKPAKKKADPITDTLELKGTTQAYQAISQACNVTVETPAIKAAKKKVKKG